MEYHPAEEYIQSFQKGLATQGIQIDSARVRSFLDPDYSTRQQFLAMVKRQGLYKTELEFVEQFRAHELQFVSQSSRGAGGPFAHNPQTAARIVPAHSDDAYWACVIAAGVGVASGCTVTLFACEAAVLACGVCAATC